MNSKYFYLYTLNADYLLQDDSGWNTGVNLKQKVWDFSKTSLKGADITNRSNKNMLSLPISGFEKFRILATIVKFERVQKWVTYFCIRPL